jgi:hypothetical protein
MARTTGLEPATSGVTGRRSNQLNYVPTVGAGAPRGRARRLPHDLRDARTRRGPAETRAKKKADRTRERPIGLPLFALSVGE